MSAAHAAPGDVPAQVGPEPGEEPELPAVEELEDAAAGEPGEEAPRRRALTVPDLRPYAVPDRDAVGELRDLAADVTRTTAPRIRRGLVPLLLALLLVLRAWFTGELAPKVPALWRLVGVPLLVAYLAARTVATYPWAPLLLVPALPLAAVIARRWAARQAPAKPAAKPAGKADGKDGAEAAEEPAGKAPAGKAGKGGKAPAGKGGKFGRPTLAARLAAVLAPAPAEPSPEAPAEPSPGTPAEASAEPAEQPPAAPSRDDLVTALHTLLRGSSGVLHTTLRDHLRYPSTRAVREALDAAHIPSRSGVRSAAGNGPGVHRQDFPPLPPPREGSPGSGCSRRSEAFTNNNNGGEGPGEGLGVEGSEGEREYPFDVVPDPSGRPNAWKVIPRDYPPP